MTTPITTNVEAWRATHAGIEAGMTIGQIAAAHDLSYQMVSKWSRMTRRPEPRTIGRTVGPCARVPGRSCADCGVTLSWGDNGGVVHTRCLRCETERSKAPTRAHTATLLAWAAEHGHVPTVNEARGILGIGRSRAGDIVKLAFGPDERPIGSVRYVGRRPWPRAASDEIG